MISPASVQGFAPARPPAAGRELQPWFLPPAVRIGMTLVRDAVWHGDRCNWVGNWMDYVEGNLMLATRTFGPDFYGGTSGIAFFLSALHSVEPDRLLCRTIEGAVNQALAAKDGIARQGFYAGLPGVACGVMRAGEALGREDWIDAGLKMLGTVPVAAEHEIDVIGGAAGTIPLLLQAHTAHECPELLERAVQLGDFLCAKAHRSDAGWSWATVPASRDTTGYSHGAAGVATALLELFAATGEERFNHGAQRGYDYEQTHFSAAHSNWPDFRTDTNTPAAAGPIFGMSWCHGAPGIALSRLRAFRLTGREEFQRQAEAGLRSTCRDTQSRLQQHMPVSNFCLCHGLAGNADILLEDARPEYLHAAAAVGFAGMENHDRPRLAWPGGLPGREPTPGLMMGLAGTGYFYLRLYDRRRFSSVLTAGMPRAARADGPP